MSDVLAVELREATADDLDGLVALLAQLFAQEAEFTPDADAQRRGLDAVLGDPTRGHVLLAAAEGRAVAMVLLLYTTSTALGARVALLEDMVVDAALRGGGIGARLLAFALDRARADGCRRITLLTDDDNVPAQRFYEAHGFARSRMVPFRLLLDRPPSSG